MTSVAVIAAMAVLPGACKRKRADDEQAAKSRDMEAARPAETSAERTPTERNLDERNPTDRTILDIRSDILCDRPFEGRDILVLCPTAFQAQRLRGNLLLVDTLEAEYGHSLLDPTIARDLRRLLALDRDGFSAEIERFLARFTETVAALREKEDKDLADYLSHWPLADDERVLYHHLHLLNGLLGHWVKETRDKHRFPPVGDGTLATLERHDVGDLSRAIDDTLALRGDIDVYITEGSGYSWALLRDELELARRIFARAGVALIVRSAQRVSAPPAWQTIDTIVYSQTPPQESLRAVPFYDQSAFTGRKLASPTESAYRELVAMDRVPPRRLVLVTHRTGIYHHLEFPDGEPEVATFEISGISFPAYSLEDRVDPALRGVMGLFSYGRGVTRYTPGTLAHELGHKLLNVSHEAWSHGPQNESWRGGATSLMLYGFGVEIAGGEKARWHRERLHRSPHLYRQDGEQKVYNPDYTDHGRYRDGVYRHGDGRYWIAESAD